MSRPRRELTYDVSYGERVEAEYSAKQHGFNSLRHAASAFSVTIDNAIRYRPWEYSQLYFDSREDEAKTIYKSDLQ